MSRGTGSQRQEGVLSFLEVEGGGDGCYIDNGGENKSQVMQDGGQYTLQNSKPIALV